MAKYGHLTQTEPVGLRACSGLWQIKYKRFDFVEGIQRWSLDIYNKGQ